MESWPKPYRVMCASCVCSDLKKGTVSRLAPCPNLIRFTTVTQIPLCCVDDDTSSSAVFLLHQREAPLYLVSQLKLLP
jgi:hypothetical protein